MGKAIETMKRSKDIREIKDEYNLSDRMVLSLMHAHHENKKSRVTDDRTGNALQRRGLAEDFGAKGSYLTVEGDEIGRTILSEFRRQA